MPVLVTSNFDDDAIKNERASNFHYVYGNFFKRPRAANSVVSGPIWPNSNSSELLFMSSLPASIKDRIKSNREKVETPFSPL